MGQNCQENVEQEFVEHLKEMYYLVFNKKTFIPHRAQTFILSDMLNEILKRVASKLD